MAVPFYIPTRSVEHSSCPPFWPTVGIVNLWNFSLLNSATTWWPLNSTLCHPSRGFCNLNAINISDQMVLWCGCCPVYCRMLTSIPGLYPRDARSTLGEFLTERLCVRDTSFGCLSHAPSWRPGLQPRHVPRLGIEPATFWFSGRHSIHWATPARAGGVSYSCHNKLFQTQWLQTTKMYCHSYGGQKSEIIFTWLKSLCQQGHTPSGGSRADRIYSWPLPAFGGYRTPLLVATSL